MVDPHPNHTNQLPTYVNHLWWRTLIVSMIPLLRAAFHLRHVVGSQGKTLETAASGYGPRRDEVVQWERVEGPESTTRTLDSLVDGFGQRVDPVWIIASGPHILDIVPRLELLEALGAGIVDILSVGDELRRRRSVGSGHFEWRMGWWCKTQQLTLLLAAHVRHGLIWSPLPLPRDSSVHQPDKPRIFFPHSDPKLLVCGVIFIFAWLIIVLFLTLFCHPTHPYLLSPHFNLREPTRFSAIVSHLIHSIFISPYVYYWVWSVRKTYPKPCMYISVWCLLLAFPRLEINLDLSTTCLLYSNLRVVLVDYSITQSRSLVPVCVCGT